MWIFRYADTQSIACSLHFLEKAIQSLWSYWDIHFISTLTQPFFGNGRKYLQLQISLQIRSYIFSVCVFFFELLSQHMNEYEICLQIKKFTNERWDDCFSSCSVFGMSSRLLLRLTDLIHVKSLELCLTHNKA